MPLHASSGGDDRQRVREASDIVDVVGDVVQLKPKGREFVGLCPFHDDRKPSMYVVPNKQIFHCFACGAGGDVFTFVQRYHALEFGEALKLLAERAGIELSKRTPRRPRDPAMPERADLTDASQIAHDFFRAILAHPQHGELARAVIERRGISAEMVERFALGAAPDRWDGLEQTIAKKNLDQRSFVALGLLKQRDSGGVYDGFRNRLIFPIHQPQTGKPVAFGARKIKEEDEPKYLNSPESELFDKSRTLYGLHQAARSIQKRAVAVVVEGYTDVIACHQHGVTNVVGTLGTALTPGHAKLLRRLCSTVVLVFDSDEAGQRAADRAFEVLFAEPVDLKIASTEAFEGAKDPDELLSREGGVEVFERAVVQAPDLLDWHFERLAERLRGAGVAARTRATHEEIARLVGLGVGTLEPVRRRMIISHLARAAGVDEQTILHEMPGGRRPRRGPGEDADAPARFSAEPNARELALGCLLADGPLWLGLGAKEKDLLSTPAYSRPMSRAVADALHALTADGITPEMGPVFDELSERESGVEATAWATQLHQIAWQRGGESREGVQELLSDCLRRVAIDEALAGGAGTDDHQDDDAPGDDPVADAQARLDRLRGVQKEYGHNPRARVSGRGSPGRA